MKKGTLFPRLTRSFLAVLSAVFLLLSLFAGIVLYQFASAVKADKMKQTARGLAVQITTVMQVEKIGFTDLTEKEREMLVGVLNAAIEDTDLGIFLTDRNGRVLLSSEGFSQSGVIGEDAFQQAISFAETDRFFYGDLGGFFPEKALFRVVLMVEQEGADSNAKVVGAVFLSSPTLVETAVFAPLFVLLESALLMLFLFAGATYLYHRKKREAPLGELSKAARAYAAGDYSYRLPEEGSPEMIALFSAFNELAEKIDTSDRDGRTFLANVSHDLRTPMTAIGGFVQNMLNGVIPPEQYDRYLQIISDEVNRLSRLVDTLLYSSRLADRRRSFSIEKMDLAELGRTTLLSFETRLEQKRVEVTFEAPEEEISVSADPDAITRVIYNLIDNAVKFVPEKGVLRVRIEKQKEKALFSVYNTGAGIAPEDLPHVFDRFYKSDRSRGLDKSGTGLGLFIAKSILAAHHEEIWVTSRPGEYAEFFFTLPLAR